MDVGAILEYFMSFSYKNILEFALIALSGPKSMILNIDGRSIKVHMNDVHKGLKHRCEKCDKSMTSAQMLKVHIKTVHEGLKPFKCNQCEKSFSQAGNLKSHVEVVHEGLKKHKCEKCEKSFGAPGDLKKHKNRDKYFS